MGKIMEKLKQFYGIFKIELIISGTFISLYYAFYITSKINPSITAINTVNDLTLAVFSFLYVPAVLCGLIAYPISLYKTGEFIGTRVTTYQERDGYGPWRTTKVERSPEYANQPYEFAGAVRYFLYGWYLGAFLIFLILFMALVAVIRFAFNPDQTMTLPIFTSNRTWNFISGAIVVIATFAVPKLLLDNISNNERLRIVTWRSILFIAPTIILTQIFNIPYVIQWAKEAIHNF